jgi:hypothetical protein
MAALVAAWIYGARLMGDGYEELAFFRGESPDIHAYTDKIPGAEARETALAAGEHWLAVKESAKRREMPFGAASLLLGGVMVLFAARSMAGREGSRSALVQVVAVHATVMVLSFGLTRDVAAAETAFEMAYTEGVQPGLLQRFGTPDDRRRAEAMRPTVLPAFYLLMREAFVALIVIALTRPRARAFFRESEPGPLSEG